MAQLPHRAGVLALIVKVRFLQKLPAGRTVCVDVTSKNLVFLGAPLLSDTSLALRRSRPLADAKGVDNQSKWIIGVRNSKLLKVERAHRVR